MRLFWLFLISILVGCAAPPASAPMKTQVQVPYCVLVFDSVLAEKISISHQSEEYPRKGLYVARTVIQNESAATVKFYAQTFFKDTFNQTIDTSPLRVIEIAPGKSFVYAAHSTASSIQRWLVYVRPIESIGTVQHRTPVLLHVRGAEPMLFSNGID